MDIDKVIKGLEHHGKGGSQGCLGCPYELTHGCQLILCHDALALIKEQEAEWIYGEDETGADGWHCSYCGFFEPWFYEFTDDIDFIRFYSFCPSCGRRMTSYTGKPTQTNAKNNALNVR
jgi:hypothetical protein